MTPLRGAALAVALLLAPGAAPAQQPPAPPAAPSPQDDLAQRKQTAITKGVRWLSEQQKPDGSWSYDNMPLRLDAYPMASGVTALSAFALLKCGVAPDEPHVQKAFEFIHGQPLQWTYAVSCVLLAIEARVNYEAPAPEAASGRDTTERRPPRRPRPSPQDLQLAQRCVDFICANQQKGLWRYPSGTSEDVSNAQYALLALDAAERLGLQVKTDVYEKVATRLVEIQEETGPDVPPFSVPGADKTYRELHQIQADMEKEIHQIQRRFAHRERDEQGQTVDDRTGTVERGAARKIYETSERQAPMKARGWAYMGKDQAGAQAWQLQVNGSMTASGLAALFICKSHLEGSSRFEGGLKPRVNQALRDGAAWLAQNFSVAQNPGGTLHHYYYLYGLERAGILGLIGRLGTHDWYSDGSNLLLDAQHPDGSWLADRSTAGTVPDTCFALLFLCRGTTPVVNIPARVMTGGGDSGGSRTAPPATPPATPPAPGR